MPTPIGAHVEIIEPLHDNSDPETMPAIKPSRVRINGVDVGTIRKGSVLVDPGNGDPSSEGATQVTLTLYARRVEIRAEPASADE
jgi:hypothetical protein